MKNTLNLLISSAIISRRSIVVSSIVLSVLSIFCASTFASQDSQDEESINRPTAAIEQGGPALLDYDQAMFSLQSLQNKNSLKCRYTLGTEKEDLIDQPDLGEYNMSDEIKSGIIAAAEQGDPIALANLWTIQGMENKAITLLTAAAEQGDPIAQTSLGAIYGVGKNYAEALKWLTAAAEQGDPIAQYNLGQMYAKGVGVEKNKDTGLKWLNNAAQQGEKRAKSLLEELYKENSTPLQ